MKKTMLALAFSLPAFAAACQNAPSAPPDGQDGPAPDGEPPVGRPPRSRDPAFEAALAECMKSLGASPGQRPERDKMDACMSAKGFERPADGPDGHRGPGGMPPPENEQAPEPEMEDDPIPAAMQA